jgi:hypothetical protein
MLIQDVQYGLRQLARDPGFAAVAVVTLALGIGANTAIFSLIDALLLRPLPVLSPGELVELWTVVPAHDRYLFSYPIRILRSAGGRIDRRLGAAGSATNPRGGSSQPPRPRLLAYFASPARHQCRKGSSRDGDALAGGSAIDHSRSV